MKTDTFLEQLGFHRHWVSFACAEEMIQAYMDGYDGKLSVLYSEISKTHNCHAERALRYAIGAAMDKNPAFFRILGLPETRWCTSFTNKEFLVHVAYLLKQLEATEAQQEQS